MYFAVTQPIVCLQSAARRGRVPVLRVPSKARICSCGEVQTREAPIMQYCFLNPLSAFDAAASTRIASGAFSSTVFVVVILCRCRCFFAVKRAVTHRSSRDLSRETSDAMQRVIRTLDTRIVSSMFGIISIVACRAVVECMLTRRIRFMRVPSALYIQIDRILGKPWIMSSRCCRNTVNARTV